MTVQIDHVLIAVPDLDRAAARLERQHGLAAVTGGRHPGWGTANRIVPLGATYLELVTVVDAAEAGRSPFGDWVLSMLDGGPVFGWAVRTDDLDTEAARLALVVGSGSRANASGRQLRWRIAGIEQAAAEPSLPFFIEWGADTPLPGRTPVTHPAGRVELDHLDVTGDADRVEHWLGRASIPIRVGPGSAAVRTVALATSDGPAEIAAADWAASKG